MYTVYTEIYQGVDRGCPSGVLFLDLKKAFDMVNHEILLSKLKLSDLKARAVNWVWSYLGGRLQVTKVGGVKSPPPSMACGVPQGSILGPLLFIVYINDLPLQFPNHSIHLYADDTAITVSNVDPRIIEQQLNLCLRIVNKWFAKDKLTLNFKKSKVMYFGTRRQLEQCTDLIVQHPGKELECVDSYKYLGIVPDSQLSFSEHVKHVRNKTIAKIRVLGGVRSFMDQSTATMLFKTLVLPRFHYNDFIYDCLNSRDQLTLQRLQNTCARNILKAEWMTPSALMHKELNLLKLTERRDFHTSCEMYKIVHQESIPQLVSKFTYVSDVYTRSTRSSTNDALYQPMVNLEICKNNFVYRG